MQFQINRSSLFFLAWLSQSEQENAVVHVFVALVGGIVHQASNLVFEHSALLRMLPSVSDYLKYMVLSITKIRLYLASIESSLGFLQPPFCNVDCFSSWIANQINAVVNRINVVSQCEHLLSAARPYFVLLLHKSVQFLFQAFEQTEVPWLLSSEHILSNFTYLIIDRSKLTLLWVIMSIHVYVALILPFVLLYNLICEERWWPSLLLLILTGNRLIICWRLDKFTYNVLLLGEGARVVQLRECKFQ